MAKDSQVGASTVRNYFEILNDTLIGRRLQPWNKSTKIKESATDKFYLFDSGVARQLQGRMNYAQGTPEFGDALEAYVHHELSCFIEYRSRDSTLHYWRTHSGYEVDFVLNGEIAIEVKATSNPSKEEIKGLLAFKKEYQAKRLILVCQDPFKRVAEGVEIVPVRAFLDMLWGGEIVKN